MELLLRLLIWAYATVGIISTVGYIPTIKDLYHHKRKSANIDSYAIWTVSSAITLLYSLFILPDLLFQIVSGLNFVCCALILGLSIRLGRHK